MPFREISLEAAMKKCNTLDANHVVLISGRVTMKCARTGMAQRQRAGLITPRSQDRNLLPVVELFSFFSDEKIERIL